MSNIYKSYKCASRRVGKIGKTESSYKSWMLNKKEKKYYLRGVRKGVAICLV
jgi:hypothetical protein